MYAMTSQSHYLFKLMTLQSLCLLYLIVLQGMGYAYDFNQQEKSNPLLSTAHHATFHSQYDKCDAFKLRWSSNQDTLFISERTSLNEYVTRMKCWIEIDRWGKTTPSSTSKSTIPIAYPLICRCENTHKHQHTQYRLEEFFTTLSVVYIVEACNFSRRNGDVQEVQHLYKTLKTMQTSQ